MRYGPCGKQRRFVFLHFCHKSSNALRWTRREARRLLVLRALDEEWEQDRHDECDNGEGDERHGPDATYFAGEIVGCLDISRGIIAEIDFADPGCAVEEERKPACSILVLVLDTFLGSIAYRSKPRTEPDRLPVFPWAGSSPCAQSCPAPA